MDSVDTTTPQVELPSASSRSQMLEATTKSLAAAAIILYVCGYLVLSVHHSQYGAAQIDPFKPRIISAGGWFVIMTAIPILTVTQTMGSKRRGWYFALSIQFPFFVGCCSLAIPTAIIFSNDAGTLLSPNWYEISALLVCSMAFARLGEKDLGQRWFAAISACASLIFAVWSGINISKRHGAFTFSSLVLWFYLIGLFTMLEMMSREPPRLKDTRWIKTFFMMLVCLFVFSRAFFPHIRSSWGGGSAVVVTVRLGKESAADLGTEMRGLLIEQDETGIYLLPEGHKSAVFLPRAEIRLITFAEPSPSEAL